MTKGILNFVREARRRHPQAAGRTLEVGSYDVNGSIRPLFADATEYAATDARPGPGVDVVLDAHDVLDRYGPDAFDTVVCCETLEHDPRPWVTVHNLRRVLRPGGLLPVTTPTFGFPLHRYPRDYFRFGEDAYREWIFADAQVLELAEVPGPILCCLGRC